MSYCCSSVSCAAASAASPEFALFGCDTYPGAVVKVALGAGNNPPMREGVATLPAGEDSLVSAADVGGAVFFGANTQPGQVIQAGFGAAGQPPPRESALTLGRGENDLQSVVIDAANGYGWFGTATFPGQVVKVRLGRAGQPPQRIATLVLNPGEDRLTCAVADVAGGYAWFGTDTFRGQVIKVALGSGDATPVRVGAVMLNNGESNLRSAVIDLTNRYAYFGTAVRPPGRVIKIALGSGANPPARVGAATLNADEWDLQSAVINAAGTHALFGTGQYFAETGAGGNVVKVALGTGNNPPARASALTLEAGEESLHCAVADPAAGYAWFGAAGPLFEQGRVVKVAFEADNAPPRRVGVALLNTNESPLAAATIDVPAGYALFGGGGGRPRVIKVALGSGESPPARTGAIDLLPNESTPHCAAGDPASGLAWFGTSTQPGNVVLTSYSQKGFIKGTRLVLTESAAVTNVHFYSHRATGRLRLALYARNGPDRVLVWQSGLIVNTADQDWLVAPIRQGAPASLRLSAGTHDLCWQVDTTADVPSHVAGGGGDGFFVPADFGAFPIRLTEASNNWITTSERWASYVSYDVPPPEFTRIRVTGDVVTLEWLSNPGSSYQVQRCSVLLPLPVWTDVGAPTQAMGTTTLWSEPGAVGTAARFYRLELR